MEIRRAVPEDGEAACSVLRRSITLLCTADHRDDPVILAHWLANKTPAQLRGWIASDQQSVFVAVEDDTVLGVGSITSAGRIGLNYVAPEARFRGVSKAMLASLEAQARRYGMAQCVLESTATARRLYLSGGYAQIAAPIRMFGTASYPMAKRLVPGQ